MNLSKLYVPSSSRVSGASRGILAVDACKGEISRLAPLARDDKAGGFARGDKRDGDGWDGGHRHRVVPALVVLLRCMMVPQYGHRLLSCIPGQTGLSTSTNPSLENASRHVSHILCAVPLYQRKNYQTEATPTPTRTRKRFPTHLCAPTHICAYSQLLMRHCRNRANGNTKNPQVPKDLRKYIQPKA
ncbi:hypothetical protein BAQU_0716 [Bifidobacterium aquikefiri]|uniref:Uncharacterized protein n=1 Tax=Bifidobacterium aquikefiri TaxID=1653207 RepID=A0A261G892_9BIFI|nr:hypothetical protein BAQU_0716 [Bifidobacterium aquikefiri]